MGGMQQLSPRSVRRITRTTGVDNIIRAAAQGGYWHTFTTADHAHGTWHRRTHQWGWLNSGCTSYCWRHFPDTPPVQHDDAVDAGPPPPPPTMPASIHDAIQRKAASMGARAHVSGWRTEEQQQ